MKVILTGEEYRALETKANRAASDRKELVDFQREIKEQLEGIIVKNAECETHCTPGLLCDKCDIYPFIITNDKEAAIVLQNVAAKIL